MLFSKYPYHNFSDYNLDYIIYVVDKMKSDLETFINFNAIKYADPILWNITKQYEANTVVINPYDGTAYISTKPVPYGVNILNTDYWTPIFNYGESMNELREQIAESNEELNETASKNYNTGNLVWLNGLLYECTSDIVEGTRFVSGTNVTPITIEEFIHNEDNEIYELIEQTRYTVADFGIFPTDTDCADALQELLNNGIDLVFPCGVYTIGKRLINSLGCSITGSGSQNTVLKFTGVNAEAGIDNYIGNSGISSNPLRKKSITVSGISIINASNVSYSALYFDGTSSLADRTTTGPTIKDVVISGADGYGWDTGIYLYGCNGAVIHNASICGKQPTAGTYGIRINTPTSYQIGTEFLITDTRISYFVNDLFADRAEGIQISNSVFLATQYGVNWQSTTGQHPHLTISNCHMNCNHKDIVTHDVYQILIIGNLLYQNNAQSYDDSKCIDISGVGTNSIISDNVIIGITNSNDNTTAIEFNSNRSSIKNNVINMGGGGVGIVLGNDSTRNEVLNNIISARTRFVNNGTLNKNDLKATGTLTNVHSNVTLAGQNYVEYLQDGVMAFLTFAIGAGGVDAGSTLFKIDVPSTVETLGNFAVYPYATGFGTKVLRFEADGTVKNTSALLAGDKYHFAVFLKYAVV